MKRGGGLEEEGEYIELIEMGFEEVYKKLLAADFNDAKTLLLVQHFFLRNPLKALTNKAGQ